MTRIYASLLPLSIMLASCGTTPEPVPVTEAMWVGQEEMCDGLYEGQALGETLALIENFSVGFFDIKEKDVVHQYVEAFRPETRIRFGVYFENKHLVALLLEQDVAEFFSCRRMDESGHWLNDGIAPYREWILVRNQLGQEFDRRIYHTTPVSSGGMDLGYTIEALSWTPVIAVALGAAAIDHVAGGSQRAAKARRELDYIERMAPTIQIGDSDYTLISAMGSYVRKDDAGTATVFTYSQPSYSYGFLGDKLVWKESPSMILQRSYRPDSCATIQK